MIFKSIRNRLIFHIGFFVTLLLLTIAISVYAYFRHTTKELIFSQQFSMVSLMANGLDDKIESSHGALIALSKVVPVASLNNRDNIQKWLNDRVGTRSIFNHGLFLLDMNGDLLVYTSDFKHDNSNYFRMIFAQSRAKEWKLVSTPVICSANQHQTVLMTAPVFGSDGSVNGILCGAIDLLGNDSLFQDIIQTRQAFSGYMYLFSKDRTMVVHKDTSRIGKKDVPIGSNRLFDMAIAGFEGSDENFNSLGVHFLTSVKRLKYTDWILAANYPYDEAMLPIARFRNAFILGMLVALLAGIAMARKLGTTITRPLSELTLQVSDLSGSNSDHEKFLFSSDKGEIGNLTEAFNALLLDIRKYEEEQRILSNMLEEEIAERQKSEEVLSEQTKTLLKNERHLTEKQNELLATEEMLRVQIGEFEVTQRLLWEANDRFRALQEASFGGICIHDNGVILDCNRALSDISGYPEEMLLGMNMLDLIEPSYHESLLEIIQSGFEQPYEVEGVNSDGIRYWLKMRGKSVPYMGHQVRVVEFRDITDRKQAEEERLTLEQQFQHAQKLESLGVLAGGIAHDFNNILTSIIGQCFMARKNVLSPESYQDRIEAIEKAVHRAADLCRQMLTYAGKNKPEQTDVNMKMLTDEIVKMLKATVKKNVSIELDLLDDISHVSGDNAQIQQIVMNLIINAADSIGDDNGSIKVSLAKVLITPDQKQLDFAGNKIPPAEYCCLTVADTGCGMDEAIQKRIFEPFFTTKFTGRGLGMSAILGIIKSHNGALQLSSTPGVGTTFKVFLLISEPVESSVIPTLTESVQTPEIYGTILLVDDEEILRDVGQAMLEILGVSVITATNGSEAVEIYRQQKSEISLILLDLIMPVMGGAEAYQELRKISPTVPVVICTGYGVEEIEETIEHDEYTGFIQKPYRPERLQNVLSGLMKK